MPEKNKETKTELTLRNLINVKEWQKIQDDFTGAR